MLVHFITDEPTKFPAVRAMLEPRHEVVACLLGSCDAQTGSHGVFVVDVPELPGAGRRVDAEHGRSERAASDRALDRHGAGVRRCSARAKGAAAAIRVTPLNVAS